MNVGPYQLLRPLGTGGMAEVWQAQWLGPGGIAKTVALKWPREPEIGRRYRHSEAFAREQRVSMLMTHSNIVQVFDVGTHEGRPYMVMEWVDGVHLAKLVERLRSRGEALGLGEVAYVVGEILRGLAYAHSLEHEGAPLGIVHRDVSPQNVLVSVSGEIKLVDFGIARATLHETSGEHVKGKLRYMAPEQLVGDDHGAAVDLYATGVILHELVAGARMRDARGDEALMAMVRAGHVPPLRDLPEELDALRLALLSPDPAERPDSARDALRLLARWPGYRPLSAALARRVTDVMAVSAPRSGVVHPAPAEVASRPTLPLGSAEWAARPEPPPRAATELVVATPPEPERLPESRNGWATVRLEGRDSAATVRDLAAAVASDGGGTTWTIPRPRTGASPRSPALDEDALTARAREARPSTIRWLVPSIAATAGLAALATGLALASQEPSDREPRAERSRVLAHETSFDPRARGSTTRGLGHGVPAESVPEDRAPQSLAADGAAVPTATDPTSDLTPPSEAQDTAREGGDDEGALSRAALASPATPPSGSVDTRASSPEAALQRPRRSRTSTSSSAETLPDGPEASEGEASEGGQGTDSGERASSDREGPQEVQLVVKSGDLEWAVLRVDLREILIEPRATLQLAAGRHSLAVRGPGETDFVDLDPIDLEGGARYVLRLRSPAGYGLARMQD